MTTTADELASLHAENAALKAKIGLSSNGTPTRELLFREIASGLLLEEDAVRSIKKFGFEESHVRLDLVINGDERKLEIPVKKLFTVSVVRGYVAEVCNKALPYEQKQWTRYANYILTAAEQCPGYSRDIETAEWVTTFAQRACGGFHGGCYTRPVADGAVIYDRILSARGRRGGVLEASHTGEVFFIRRQDDGISFGQDDFIGFVWAQMAYRLTRGELDQRLASIGFKKAPQFARKGSQVAKLKACWHSPPRWLQDHEVDLPEPTPSRGGDERKN